MNLLVITQAVDKDDPVLGFFHGWLEAFNRRWGKLEVICLKRGRTDLPTTVKLHSLGKEKGKVSRVRYLGRLAKHLWICRGAYQTVFVHMTPIYVVMAWWWWRIWGVRIVLWYNHPRAGWIDRLGLSLADVVCYTSPASFSARYCRAQRMPVGVDVDLFSGGDVKDLASTFRLLVFGRVARIKRVEQILEVSQFLSRYFPLETLIAGPVEDLDYLKFLQNKIVKLGLSGQVRWLKQIPHERAVSLYRESGLMLNLTPPGSLDKTIFEALACGTMVITTNRSFADEGVPRELSPWLFSASDDVEDIANLAKKFFNLQEEQRRALKKAGRDFVVNHHSLEVLLTKLESIL